MLYDKRMPSLKDKILEDAEQVKTKKIKKEEIVASSTKKTKKK